MPSSVARTLGGVQSLTNLSGHRDNFCLAVIKDRRKRARIAARHEVGRCDGVSCNRAETERENGESGKDDGGEHGGVVKECSEENVRVVFEDGRL